MINLNAASYYLLAGALASGKEIVVAMRDLLEISQGARIGDILESSGAKIVAVGSANCVYIEDYENAIGAGTALILRVHPSNTASRGYTAHVREQHLVQLAHANNIAFAENLGGGSLVDLSERGLPPCPTLGKSVERGADLVLASGDKIIGGPQSGIVVGRREWVELIAQHPLARTCRPDKLTLAALDATLAVYASGRAWEEIPVLKMLGGSEDSIKERAGRLSAKLTDRGWRAVVTRDTAECGGAVLPGN